MRRLTRKEIFAHTALMTVGTVLTGFLNFVFNMLVGRLLGPTEYGLLSPLMGSLFSILSVPALGMQLFMNQTMGEVYRDHPEGLRSFVRFLFVNMCKMLAGVEVILWILFPWLLRWLRVDDSWALVMVFLMLFVSYLQLFGYTLLQFQQAFPVLFWVTVATTVLKLVMGVLLAQSGKATMVMWAYLVPMVVGGIIYAFAVWGWYTTLPNESFQRPSHFWRSLFVSMFSGGAYTMLQWLDVLLVRFFFPDGTVVGNYAMAGLLARASFFLATAFTTVFLPVLSHNRERARSLTMLGVGILFVLLLVYLGAVKVFAPFIVAVLLGKGYVGLESYLVMYVFWFIPYALISFLMSFYTVKKSFVYSGVILVGIVVECVLFGFWHESIEQALAIVGGVGYGVLLLFLGEILWNPSQERFS